MKYSEEKPSITVRGFSLARSASLLALAAAWAAPAAAQGTSPTDAASDTGGIADIIVTAQKREQSLQDVPTAVTALNQDTLQVNRVTSVNDLSGLAPGLVSRQAAGSLGQPNFAMRGVFANGSVASQDRQISVYVDGVYIGSNRGGVFDFPDLERIEVLRGPQGTLFGRNSTAGAISVITKDPTGEFSVRQDLTVGNYSQLRTRTTVSTPQVGPFSAYATYVHDERRGDVRNLGAGTVFDRTNPFTKVGVTASPKYLGGRNFENVFAALKFEPSDNFKMVYKFDRSAGDVIPEARVTNFINPSSFVGALMLDIIAAQQPGGGKFGPITIHPDNKRPKATNNAWTQTGFTKASGHSLTITWEPSDAISVKNITAYRRSKAYGPASTFALEGLVFTQAAVAPYARFAAISTLGAGFFALTPEQQAATLAQFAAGLQPSVGQYFAGYVANNYGRNHQFSNELQVNYDSDFMTLTAGIVYYRAYAKDSGLPGFAPAFLFAPLPTQLPLGNIIDSDARVRSLAGYAQAEFHITPQLDLIAGGRITRDKKSGDFVTGGTFVGSRTGTGSIVGTSSLPFAFKKTKPTFSLGANYKPNPDTLIYAKYSTGFLSGGGVGPISFAPETVKSQEIGIKTELFDRRVRANLALYNAVYDHAQTPIGGISVGLPAINVLVIDNGRLKAKGFELELTAAPTHGLVLGGSLAYSKSKLTSPNVLATGGRKFMQGGIAPWVAAVNAQYETQPLFGDATLLFRVDANYSSRYPFNFSDANIDQVYPGFGRYQYVPSRWLLNGRVALRQIALGPVEGEIAVWSKNITNNKDSLYPIQFGDIQFDTSFQPARTFGLDLSVKFQ